MHKLDIFDYTDLSNGETNERTDPWNRPPWFDRSES
jgi:hypothetical protein